MKILLASLAISIPALAFAVGHSDPGFIEDIQYLPGEVVVFHSTGAPTGRPSCASGQLTRWTVAASTVEGKQQLSALLAAYYRNKRVEISGTGDCRTVSDMESVEQFRVVEPQ